MLPDGREIIIDCVVDEFNYEEPYTEIKDTKMDLQLLDGIEENEPKQDQLHGQEAEWESLMGMDELYGDDELGQLGFSFKKFFKKVGDKIGDGVRSGARAVKQGVKATGTGISNAGKFVGKTAVKAGKYVAENAKKGLHYLNKFNPATVLLRNGLLASFKLNIFNVAHNLRLSYLNKDDAAKRNLNSGKHDSIVGIREKLENIFYAAGGDPANMKKAILTGKGNHGDDKVLAGLEGIDGTDFEALEGMDENTPIYQLLGHDLYRATNIVSEEDLQGLREFENETLQGFEERLSDHYQIGDELHGLGEPATISIAAASGALATIAGLIKNLGNLYDKGKAVADNVKSVTDVVQSVIPSGSGNSNETSETTSSASSSAPDPESSAPSSPSSAEPPADDPSPEPQPSEDSPQSTQVKKIASPKTTTALVVQPKTTTPAKTTTASTAAAPVTTQGFWEKHKKWLKPTLIGVGGFGILYLGYRLVKSKTQQAIKPTQSLSGLNGKKKKKNTKKEAVTLL
jgi:hypothetical protein